MSPVWPRKAACSFHVMVDGFAAAPPRSNAASVAVGKSIVDLLVACGLAPLPPTPSPKRRGGERQEGSFRLPLSASGRGLGGGVWLAFLSHVPGQRGEMRRRTRPCSSATEPRRGRCRPTSSADSPNPRAPACHAP